MLDDPKYPSNYSYIRFMTTKKYLKDDIQIQWEPSKCVHSRKCWTSLGSVFDPRNRPWINPDGASKDEIIAVVSACPSGALSIIPASSDTPTKETQQAVNSEKARIQLSVDGPLLFEGECVILDADGNESYKSGKMAFCRCGASANKPFCDGSHRKVGFKS